jgi:hypothetical protein
MSQGKVAVSSMMFSSKRRHPIREGQFPCSSCTAQVGRLAIEIQGWHIDKYDGYNNSEEFIQVYHTVIEVVES